MLKIILLILTVTIINSPSLARADQIDAIIDMSIKQMQNEKDFGEMTKCLGISKPKMLEGYRKVLRFCFDNVGFEESEEDAMGACLDQQRKQQLGISDAAFAKCDEKFPEEDEQDPSANADVDFENMSPEEYQKQMDKQIALDRQNSEEAMNAMTEMFKSSAKGTENLVTLPIFQPSEIASHFVKGMTSGAGKQTLPVATFSSSSKLKRVVDFYKKELPGFEVNSFEDSYTFMKKIPQNFENISINKINMNGKETVTIAITYQK